MKLSKATGELKPFEIVIGSDSLKGHYRPGQWTGKFVDELESLGDGEQPGFALARVIELVVADWDLTDDTGTIGENENYPLVKLEANEIYAKIPIVLIGAIVRKIQELQRPGEENSGTSSGSF